MHTAQEVREIIIELLKKNNKSSSQMLKELGLNNSLILDMGRRNSMPSADKLGKIAKYLNCSSDYLLGLEKNNPNSEIVNFDNHNKNQLELLDIFNKLTLDYQEKAISQVFDLLIEMCRKQDEELNSNKAYIAAFGGGVFEIDDETAKFIEENAVFKEYKPKRL